MKARLLACFAFAVVVAAAIAIGGPSTALTPVDARGPAHDGFSAESIAAPQAVPLPASLPLLASAMVGLALLSRTRAHK